MTIEPNLAIAIMVPVALVFVWLLRLEGRVNLNAAEMARMREDVQYIRERIDDLLGRRQPNQ